MYYPKCKQLKRTSLGKLSQGVEDTNVETWKLVTEVKGTSNLS